MDLRAGLWALADYLESKAGFIRRWRYWLLAAVVALIALGFGYAHWRQQSSLRVARQWLDAARLDRAAPAIQLAIAEQPGRPEPWSLAAQLAWRRKQKAQAVGYAAHAADLSHDLPIYVLDWAELAVLASDRPSAEKAMARLAPDFIAHSARAERVAAVLARQRQDFDLERKHFAAALRLDAAAHAPTEVDDVPLQTLIYRVGKGEERIAARQRLEQWMGDRRWGADALRGLLAEAVSRQNRSDEIRFAEALRAHPLCSLEDLPTCLLALSAADEVRFQAMLTALKQQYRANDAMIVLLMGDLIRIGRPAEVVKWEHDLPESVRQSPRLSVAVAEALRLTGEWAALKSWVERAHWTAQSEFMHTMYRMDAAHGLGDRSGLADAYKELKEQVQDNGAFALFAGVNLYTTGMQAEAVPLFWAAADSPNVAMDALGTLARHYQSEHDAVGQYQAFRRLHALRPEDPGIANNYAYFAVVAGQFNFNEIERIVRENHLREPANPLYLANYAFLLQATGRVQAALDLVQPRAEVWRQSEPFAFAYGLVLAADGRKTEAREVLARIKPEPLSVQERELLRSALN